MKTTMRSGCIATRMRPTQVLKMNAQTFAKSVILALFAALLMSTQLLAQTTPVDWTVGDVFAGTGNGSYQVWHSANPSAQNPTYTNIQTINDGSTNSAATGGCAFDLAYRFFGTNFTNTLVDRYAIDNGHAIVQPLAGGSGASLSQSVVFDSGPNLFIGYAGGVVAGIGTIEKWTKDMDPANLSGTYGLYTLKASFSVPVDNAGPGWVDLAADGHTIFYTSQGRKIYKFDTSTLISSIWADLSTLNGSNSQGTLYAIKLLGPNYDGTNGVLVADQGNVKLVTVSGGVISVQVFKFNPNGNLQALALDAFNPLTTFWVGDASANKVIQFNMSTGKNIVTIPTGSGTTLGGVCVDGGFSGAELHSRQITTTPFTLTSASNTLSFNSPYTGAVFTATLPGLANNVTATLRDSLVDASLALTDPTVFSYNLGNPNFGLSTVPGNMPCDQTLTNLNGTCEVFELEANPNSGFAGTSVQINGPNNLPDGLPNPRLVRNLDEDITDDIDLTGTRSPGKCVYTVNQQKSNPTLEICGGGFSSPASGQSFTKNQTASISFKFKVSPLGQCPNGQGPTNLQPLLMIVQLQPSPGPGLPTPVPVDVPVIVAGNSGGPPTFVLSGNTWQLQVKTTDMPAGFTYVATMVDLTAGIPAISVTFTLN